MNPLRIPALCGLLGASLASGCDTPHTWMVVDNLYPAAAPTPRVVYRASWLTSSLASPVPPGQSSAPVMAVPASANTAYVLLAPGWDPSSGAAPTSFVVLQSRTGLDLHLDDTLHIAVDDTTFEGNCAAGSVLTQAQADVITQNVFASDFAALHYDAATCTTTVAPMPLSDAGGPG